MLLLSNAKEGLHLVLPISSFGRKLGTWLLREKAASVHGLSIFILQFNEIPWSWLGSPSWLNLRQSKNCIERFLFHRCFPELALKGGFLTNFVILDVFRESQIRRTPAVL